MTEEKPEKKSGMNGNGTEPLPPIYVNIPEAELEQIKKESNEFKDKYLRSLAESDNMRKRLQKERQELTQFAIENVIAEILDPIDNLENALKFTQQSSDEVKNWALGFQMILNKFKDVLANHGVVPFESLGMPFDPHFHEAIEMVISKECKPGTVIEETTRGYKMGGRAVRPARVKVSKAEPETSMELNKE